MKGGAKKQTGETMSVFQFMKIVPDEATAHKFTETLIWSDGVKLKSLFIWRFINESGQSIVV